MAFFKEKFNDLNAKHEGERTFYMHATHATDTQNISLVFTVVQKVILDKIMGDTMIN